MIATDKRMRLNTCLLICTLFFIWGNSLLPGSVSGAISDWVKWVLSQLFSTGPETESGGLPLRKLAHFTEFATLGILLSWRFGMRNKWKGFAWVCGTAVACVDETIQVFVPDRGPSVRDVLLDSCGVAAGMLLLYLGHTYYTKKKQTHLEDK